MKYYVLLLRIVSNFVDERVLQIITLGYQLNVVVLYTFRRERRKLSDLRVLLEDLFQ